LRSIERFNTILEPGHVHADLDIVPITSSTATTPLPTPITLHQKVQNKHRKWKDYQSIGDDYLKQPAECTSPANCPEYPPFLVLLGQLFFMQYDKLLAFSNALTSDQLQEVEKKALEWKGFTLLDALIYGQLCRSTLPGAYPKVIVSPDVFQRVYELQYGKDLQQWAKYADVPMLAEGHHSYIFVEPDASHPLSPRVLLYTIAVYNQMQKGIDYLGEELEFAQYLKKHVDTVFARHLTLAATALSDEDQLIQAIVMEHVMPALRPSLYPPGSSQPLLLKRVTDSRFPLLSLSSFKY
jgi:hypothetical protein